MPISVRVLHIDGVIGTHLQVQRKDNGKVYSVSVVYIYRLVDDIVVDEEYLTDEALVNTNTR